jgi:membrane protease YdiL (CAAX protease family)
MERSLVGRIGEVTQDEPFARRKLSLWQVVFIVITGMTIAGCEWVFAYQNVAWGISIALGITIGLYLVLSTLRLDQRVTDCGESLALIPLYILFTSSAVYSCVLGLCLWHVYQKDLSLKQIFGFSKGKLLKYSLIGLAIGIPTGTVEYLVLQPDPTFPVFEIKYFFRDMAYMLLFVGMAEELLFRGLIQQDFTKAFGWRWGLFTSSAIFAVMHLTWRSVPELAFVFIAGLILGTIYAKTKSLVAPIIAHGINNLMLVAVLPYIFMR